MTCSYLVLQIWDRRSWTHQDRFVGFASVARTTQTCPRDIFDQRNSVILPAAVINERTTLYAHIFRKAGNRSANARSRRIERHVLPGQSLSYTGCTKTYQTESFCWNCNFFAGCTISIIYWYIIENDKGIISRKSSIKDVKKYYCVN